MLERRYAGTDSSETPSWPRGGVPSGCSQRRPDSGDARTPLRGDRLQRNTQLAPRRRSITRPRGDQTQVMLERRYAGTDSSETPSWPRGGVPSLAREATIGLLAREAIGSYRTVTLGTFSGRHRPAKSPLK